MGKPSKLLGLGAAVIGFVGAPSVASAQAMNPALSRLVLDHRCHAELADMGRPGTFAAYSEKANNVGVWTWDKTTTPNGNELVRSQLLRATGRDTCAPDDVAFKQLVAQLGFALAPSAMHSARTTGFGGFHFSLEGGYTKIDDSASYWKLGTQGSRDPSSNKGSKLNASPASLLQVYSARVRKSFGFGLEVATQVGFMPDTTLLSGGADVRMSLLEGFRTGFLGILPDVAVGGGVRTITGTPELQLTVAGLDVQLSKPLPIASQSVLTPFIGYQYLWIFGDSGLIDLTPGTDAVGYCQQVGTDTPGTPGAGTNVDSDGNPVFDGQPVCGSSADPAQTENASPLDFNNNVVFNNARLERQRLMVGLNYRYEMVMVGGEFIFDLVAPGDAQTGKDDMRVKQADGTFNVVTDKDALKDVERQWTLVLEVGAMF